MWRDQRAFSPECPECGSLLSRLDKYQRHATRFSCYSCKETVDEVKLLRCKGFHCKFQLEICYKCHVRDALRTYVESEIMEKRKRNKNNKKELEGKNGNLILYVIPIFLVAIIYFLRWKSASDSLVEKFKNLKRDFPSQTSETWQYYFSVLHHEGADPSVKSITFLHGDDKRTSDCLTKELVSLFTQSETVEMENIVFSAADYEGRDPGHALVHYHKVMKAFRVLVIDLTKTPGSIAKIFHYLCDEYYLDVKPSLFIFTLRFDESMEKPETKPLTRARRILQESWKDLPGNIIHPLLSRVLRNVVEIKPEQGSC